MDPLIILVFVLTAGFFFVLLTRWQRSGEKSGANDSCGHDHSDCCDPAHDHSHDHGHHHHHHDHKDGGCCGGKH